MATLRDWTTLGALAGAGAILVRDGYSLFSKMIGFAKFYVWSISADLFLRTKEVNTALGTTLGLLADLATGALIGVVFVHFLRWTKGKNPILKGWGFGVGSWLLLYGLIFHNLPHTVTKAPAGALSNLSALIGHSIFGLALGYATQALLKRLAMPEAAESRAGRKR